MSLLKTISVRSHVCSGYPFLGYNNFRWRDLFKLTDVLVVWWPQTTFMSTSIIELNYFIVYIDY